MCYAVLLWQHGEYDALLLDPETDNKTELARVR
jgi:hypothetical protein